MAPNPRLRRRSRRPRCRRAPRCRSRLPRSLSMGSCPTAIPAPSLRPTGLSTGFASRASTRPACSEACSIAERGAFDSVRSGSTFRATGSTSPGRTRWSRRGRQRPAGQSCVTRSHARVTLLIGQADEHRDARDGGRTGRSRGPGEAIQRSQRHAPVISPAPKQFVGTRREVGRQDGFRWSLVISLSASPAVAVISEPVEIRIGLRRDGRRCLSGSAACVLRPFPLSSSGDR